MSKNKPDKFKANRLPEAFKKADATLKNIIITKDFLGKNLREENIAIIKRMVLAGLPVQLGFKYKENGGEATEKYQPINEANFGNINLCLDRLLVESTIKSVSFEPMNGVSSDDKIFPTPENIQDLLEAISPPNATNDHQFIWPNYSFAEVDNLFSEEDKKRKDYNFLKLEFCLNASIGTDEELVAFIKTFKDINPKDYKNFSDILLKFEEEYKNLKDVLKAKVEEIYSTDKSKYFRYNRDQNNADSTLDFFKTKKEEDIKHYALAAVVDEDGIPNSCVLSLVQQKYSKDIEFYKKIQEEVKKSLERINDKTDFAAWNKAVNSNKDFFTQLLLEDNYIGDRLPQKANGSKNLGDFAQAFAGLDAAAQLITNNNYKTQLLDDEAANLRVIELAKICASFPDETEAIISDNYDKLLSENKFLLPFFKELNKNISDEQIKDITKDLPSEIAVKTLCNKNKDKDSGKFIKDNFSPQEVTEECALNYLIDRNLKLTVNKETVQQNFKRAIAFKIRNKKDINYKQILNLPQAKDIIPFVLEKDFDGVEKLLLEDGFYNKYFQGTKNEAAALKAIEFVKPNSKLAKRLVKDNLKNITTIDQILHCSKASSDYVRDNYGVMEGKDLVGTKESFYKFCACFPNNLVEILQKSNELAKKFSRQEFFEGVVKYAAPKVAYTICNQFAPQLIPSLFSGKPSLENQPPKLASAVGRNFANVTQVSISQIDKKLIEGKEFLQKFPNVATVYVDNAPSPEMLKKFQEKFPQVKYIAVGKNSVVDKAKVYEVEKNNSEGSYYAKYNDVKEESALIDGIEAAAKQCAVNEAKVFAYRIFLELTKKNVDKFVIGEFSSNKGARKRYKEKCDGLRQQLQSVYTGLTVKNVGNSTKELAKIHGELSKNRAILEGNLSILSQFSMPENLPDAFLERRSLWSKIVAKFSPKRVGAIVDVDEEGAASVKIPLLFGASNSGALGKVLVPASASVLASASAKAPVSVKAKAPAPTPTPTPTPTPAPAPAPTPTPAPAPAPALAKKKKVTFAEDYFTSIHDIPSREDDSSATNSFGDFIAQAVQENLKEAGVDSERARQAYECLSSPKKSTRRSR